MRQNEEAHIIKILKWAGIVLLVIMAGATITTAYRQHLMYDAPLPAPDHN